MAQQVQEKNRPDRFQTGRVIAIAVVHFIHDAHTSFLAPLLPLLIKKMGLSLIQAGSLSVFLQIASLFNPLLGTMADRRRLYRLFVVASPGITATLMCLLGAAPGYAVLSLLLLAAGISVAALHVSAPVMISRIAGNSVGRGMGFFMVGGELARTIGPLAAVWAVSTVGLEGMWKMAPVGIAASLILWRRLWVPAVEDQENRPSSLTAMLKEMRFIITGVFGILVARSFLSAAVTTFLPTFLYDAGHSLWISGISLSVLEFAGALGVLVSGALSDRIGRRKVQLAAMILSPLLLVAMLYTRGTLLFWVLPALGFTTISTGPVLMAVMLENSGPNPAAANGTYMAISFAVRAVVILIVGAVSDAIGMKDAYLLCAVAALLAIPFILMLPKTGRTGP